MKQVFQEIASLRRARQYLKARERVERILPDHPDDLWLLRTYADLLLKLDDTRHAAQIIRRLLAEQPENPRYLTLSADRHRMEGRTGEATSCYLRALDIADDPYVRTRAIDGLLHQKRHSEAERLIDDGLRTSPRDPYLLRRRARLLAATEKPGQAAETYADAARSATGDGHRDYTDSVKLRLGELPSHERLQEALQLVSVPTHGNNPYLLALAAELAIDEKDTVAASRLLDRAETVAGDTPQALRTIGYQRNRLEQYSHVLDTLGRAFISEPRDVISQQVLFAAARKSEAYPTLRTIFVLAYERHPGFHKLNGLIRKVDKLIAGISQPGNNASETPPRS